MSTLRTSNPALRPDLFSGERSFGDTMTRAKVMTLNGTITASMILLGLCAAVGAATWGLLQSRPEVFGPAFLGSIIVGFILALVICFKPATSPFLAPVYAIVEGVFVGAASLFWAEFAAGGSKVGAMAGAGIVLQAGVLTVGITAAMLIAYATRLIRPTQTVLAGIAAATGGVFFFFIAMLVASLLGFNTGAVWSGPLGIAIAGVIVVIAAANLVLDFKIVEDGVENGAPKYMEWYAGFGLLVTLVWLYVSLLRLLALLSRRD